VVGKELPGCERGQGRAVHRLAAVCQAVGAEQTGALRALPLEGVRRARSSGQGKSCSPSQGTHNPLERRVRCAYFVRSECFAHLLSSRLTAIMTLEPPALTEQDKVIARQSSRLLRQHQGSRGLPVLQFDGVSVTLPNSFLGIVGECLEMLANGHRVSVVPMDDEIGTQEAADRMRRFRQRTQARKN
jgi:hypothetical protein